MSEWRWKDDSYVPTQYFRPPKEAENLILEYYVQGITNNFELKKLVAKNGFTVSIQQIKSVIKRRRLKAEAEDLKEQLMEELLRDKVPVLREINKITLDAILEFVKSYTTNKRKKMFATPKDMKDLLDICEKTAAMMGIAAGDRQNRNGVIGSGEEIDKASLAPVFQVIIENKERKQGELNSAEVVEVVQVEAEDQESE